MTNWMTAAGLALIAGGLATMIGFRHLLWGGGRRGGSRPRRAIEPSRRMALGAIPHVPEARAAEPRQALVRGPGTEVEAAGPVEPRRGRRTGRRRTAAARTGTVPEPRAGHDGGAPAAGAPERADPAAVDRGEPPRRAQGGLARIGLADDEDPSGEALTPAPAGGTDGAAADRTGPRATGPDLAGPRAAGPAGTGPDMTGPDTTGPDTTGPDHARPDHTGRQQAGRDDASDAAPTPVVSSGGAHDTPLEDLDPAPLPAHPTGEGTAPLPAHPTRQRTAPLPAHPMEERTAPLPAHPLREEAAKVTARPMREETVKIGPADRESVLAPRRQRAERHGDRVDGWVRPRYQDDDIDPTVSGEYWTPAPQRAYEAGYGWPVPVERLPAVPPQPPSGLRADPGAPAAGPAASAPQWPPVQPSGRIDLPRNWPARDRDQDGYGGERPLGRLVQSRHEDGNTGEAPPSRPVRVRDDEEAAGERPPAMVRRPSRSERRRAATDATELLSPVDEAPDPAPRRPRPRPRPSQPERSTVYRSRHAADPG